MFDDFDTQIHPEDTQECRDYEAELFDALFVQRRELERPEETSNEEHSSDLEWDAFWASQDLCG